MGEGVKGGGGVIDKCCLGSLPACFGRQGVTANKSSVSLKKCFIFLLFVCMTLIDLI